MAPPVPAADERRCRENLARSAQRLRTALGACPAVEDLAVIDSQPTDVLAEALRALRDAEATTLALETLQGASEDAIVLVATSRNALNIVGEVLAVLTAAADSHAQAN